jgi:RHH-type proline utilization regulon transcriptional repressor/proline dehydrogenase/delta 1-pyrroline-5-carboxylate dehydrogenase
MTSSSAANSTGFPGITAEAWRDAIHALSQSAFAPEEEVIAALLPHTQPYETHAATIEQRSHALAGKLRTEGAGFGVEAFLAEYGLDTKEGIAVMCLAEALLRIPDAATAQALVRDKFSEGQWNKHLGKSDSLFVNAASWGLLLGGKVVDLAEAKGKSAWGVISNLAQKFGEPTMHKALTTAMRMMGGQFVLGEDIGEALENSKGPQKKSYRFSYDILGEGARSMRQADAYLHAYEDAIPRIAAARPAGTGVFDGPSISVKLSGLHPRYALVQETRVMEELYPRLLRILILAKQHGICVAIDAEEANRLDIALLLFHKLAHAPELAGWNGLGYVVQAYGKRAVGVILLLAELATATGRIIPLRLVKGAYWDTEIKHAQMMGLADYPVFTRKEHTDLSYLACAKVMMEHASRFYCQFGTHNARTAESVLALARHFGVGKHGFEFQRLHGMGESLHEALLPHAASRIYAPIGAHKDLLAYLIRRLLENGANTSFVHLLLDKETPLTELLADPIARTRATAGKRNSSIPLPQNIYPDRKNSHGADLGYLASQHQLLDAMRTAKPLPEAAGAASVDTAVANAQKAFADWAALGVDARATILEHAADALEENLPALLNVLAEEAGKTLNDGIAEVREAADFCRYYAAQARAQFATLPLPGPTGESNSLHLAPRGIFACISPWNFPLAIFLGQITAALVCGNTVVAKPAEQTPRIAQIAVALLRKSGLPEGVLQLVIGDGEKVGAPLVAHPAIAGVAFTGSDATARHINRALAAKNGPIVPLIAETGGLNAMVIDSSALLEQACDDILTSAFGSAGQRCSALRILYAQEDIADDLWQLVTDAMQELRIGNPALPETDIGPVIDTEAYQNLTAHIATITSHAAQTASTPLHTPDARPYLAPHAIALHDAAQLTREVFGPVLHIVRFKASELHALPQQINAAGYGLTFGMHSRIDDHVAHFLHRIHAGNIYVNRSMIGATVGVQPFGGEGLSGTGPKAGGPHYLARFCTERTTTINIAAIGGNLALLQGSK